MVLISCQMCLLAQPGCTRVLFCRGAIFSLALARWLLCDARHSAIPSAGGVTGRYCKYICYFTIGLLTVLGARWLRVTWPLLLVCRVTCYDMRVRSRLVARMVGLGLLTFTSFGARCHRPIDIHTAILLIFSRERTAWSYMQHGSEATAALAIMM